MPRHTKIKEMKNGDFEEKLKRSLFQAFRAAAEQSAIDASKYELTRDMEFRSNPSKFDDFDSWLRNEIVTEINTDFERLKLFQSVERAALEDLERSYPKLFQMIRATSNLSFGVSATASDDIRFSVYMEKDERISRFSHPVRLNVYTGEDAADPEYLLFVNSVSKTPVNEQRAIEFVAEWIREKREF